MAGDWEQVRRWRDRSAELRRIADGFWVESARDGVLTAAQNYERLADELAHKLKAAGVPEPPVRPPRKDYFTALVRYEVEYWRGRALDARARADQMHDARRKQQLLGMANNYDELVEQIETRRKGSHAPDRS